MLGPKKQTCKYSLLRYNVGTDGGNRTRAYYSEPMPYDLWRKMCVENGAGYSLKAFPRIPHPSISSTPSLGNDPNSFIKTLRLEGTRPSWPKGISCFEGYTSTLLSKQLLAPFSPVSARVSDPENPRNPTPPSSPPHPHSLGVINTAVPTGRAKLLEANRRWRPHTVQTRPASECKQIFCILRILMQCHHHLICT